MGDFLEIIYQRKTIFCSSLSERNVSLQLSKRLFCGTLYFCSLLVTGLEKTSNLCQMYGAPILLYNSFFSKLPWY